MLKQLKNFIWHPENNDAATATFGEVTNVRKRKNMRKCVEHPSYKVANSLQTDNVKLSNNIKALNEQFSAIQEQITTIGQQLSALESNYNQHIALTQNSYVQSMKNSDEIHLFYQQTQRFFNELNYANLLHDTIIQSPWLKDKTFSLFGWAANYSFIYTLYRILDKVRPNNILEMGLGQTTRLTSQYIAYNNHEAHLTVCEHNADWINIYKQELPNAPHMDIHHFDLELFNYENQQNDKYAGLTEYVGQQKFDLIIVDGPIGNGRNLSRSNILDLINNNNLAQDFIIIFDDAGRAGEQNTIVATINLLRSKNIEFVSFIRQATKEQYIITSVSRSFAQYL